jgi:hypothetical protein
VIALQAITALQMVGRRHGIVARQVELFVVGFLPERSHARMVCVHCDGHQKPNVTDRR